MKARSVSTYKDADGTWSYYATYYGVSFGNDGYPSKAAAAKAGRERIAAWEKKHAPGMI